LVTDGETLFLVDRDPSRIMDVLQGGQFVFSLALGEIIEELQGELKQFAGPTEEKVTVENQTFTVVLTPDLEDGGFTIQCREIPGAISEGKTEQEALDNITEVLAEHLDQGQEPKAGAGQAG